MSLHQEVQLEDEICESLAAAGWEYSADDAAAYDRELGLFPADVIAWVQETQPDAWETLTKNHGAAAAPTLLTEMSSQALGSEQVQRGLKEILLGPANLYEKLKQTV